MAIWLMIDLIDWKNCSSLFPFLEKMLLPSLVTSLTS